MRVLFCSDPFHDRRVDPEYEREYQAAAGLGIGVELFSLESLLEGDIFKALKRIPQAETKETVVYRGWMIKPELYRQLYDALAQKNLQLINSPEEYTHCHYFPNSYEMIREATPLSLWADIKSVNSDFDNILKRLTAFGHKPIMIKDYVKSRKHEWEEACFIPDASDHRQVRFVVRNFVERQGTELNGGVVFREYVPLELLSKHPKSGMPLSNEYRLFFLNHRLLSRIEYWDEASYRQEAPDLNPFLEIARRLKSNFFTIDIAKKANVDWMIIEVGDGQVSGLSSHVNIEDFYFAMKE